MWELLSIVDRFRTNLFASFPTGGENWAQQTPRCRFEFSYRLNPRKGASELLPRSAERKPRPRSASCATPAAFADPRRGPKVPKVRFQKVRPSACEVYLGLNMLNQAAGSFGFS